jgi:hypothetical protein
VAFLGEFNSGKSTLVNAVADKEIAAADMFELTSWIAVYRPSHRDAVTLVHEDHSACELSLEEFHSRCKRRTWAEAELAVPSREARVGPWARVESE